MPPTLVQVGIGGWQVPRPGVAEACEKRARIPIAQAIESLNVSVAAAIALYEAIRFAPPYGLCPMCGQRIIASVDHYLPQSLHPLYAIPALPRCRRLLLSEKLSLSR